MIIAAITDTAGASEYAIEQDVTFERDSTPIQDKVRNLFEQLKSASNCHTRIKLQNGKVIDFRGIPEDYTYFKQSTLLLPDLKRCVLGALKLLENGCEGTVYYSPQEKSLSIQLQLRNDSFNDSLTFLIVQK